MKIPLYLKLHFLLLKQSAVVEKTTYNIACQASRNPKIRSKRTQANLKSEGNAFTT